MPTTDPLQKGFQLGDWQVLPDRGLLRRGETEIHVEPLPMDVLVALASRQGEVVSKDQLVESVWHGRPVSDEVITRCISLIRRALGDDARSPTFVENVPRRGYRLMLPITAAESVDMLPANTAAALPPRSAYVLPLLGGFVAITLVALFVVFRPAKETGLQPIRSVVVLPFRCQVEKSHLCFGFSETLTSTLFRLDGLTVVKGRDIPDARRKPRDIVTEFGVDALIEGQVRYADSRFIVVADLIDGRNGSVMFSNTYDGTEEAVYDLQKKVAADVSRSMAQEPAAVADPRPPARFAVFDKYSEGLYEFEKRSVDSIRLAITLFEQTIELDPYYGTAYLMLSYAYALLPEYGDESQDRMYGKAIAIAEQGVRMDPTIGDATATVHAFIAHKRGDWIAAERGYQRALAADVVYPVTHQLYSRLLASVGRLDASLEQARRARELDPQSAVLISRLAIANFWVGNMAEAERLFARAHGMNLQTPIHDLAYALFRIERGQISEARQLAKDGLEKYGADNNWVDPVFDGIEDPALREQAVAMVTDLAAGGHLPARVEITLWVLLQEPGRAMQIARRLQAEGEVFEAELLFIPRFQPLRAQADFPALMQAIGLTAYWQSVDCDWQGDALRCSGPAAENNSTRQ